MIDWRPCASLQTLKFRAQLFARIRRFFQQKAVLEVETPCLARYGASDPALVNWRARSASLGDRFLQTSPEYPMKRLLAAGSGCIFQLARVFRDDELGARHQPEFTLLEWYRVGYDHRDLMREVDAFLRVVAQGHLTLGETETWTYRALFQHYLQLDPFTATSRDCREVSESCGITLHSTANMESDDWLDLLLSHLIEPQLGRQGPCFITDYPVSQAALAKIRSEDPPVAERFELYYQGVELANGFHELTDAQEQAARFAEDLLVRERLGLAPIAADQALLAALAAGLPACAGVALGVDRLLMLLLQHQDIAQGMAFPVNTQ